MTKFIDCSNEAKEEKKETVFTHIQNSENGWVETHHRPTDYELVKYVGKCKQDGYMFTAYDNGLISVFKGIKGSEFD